VKARIVYRTGVVALGIFFLRASLPAEPAPAFSDLSPEKQERIRKSLAPPPLIKRRNPYSTPMYYPMWGSGSPDGKPHPEWQDVLIKDWADLGLTRLHFYAYPQDGTNRSYTLTSNERAGIRNYLLSCDKNGLKNGLRVDLPCEIDNSKGRPVPNYWIAHPDNPQNELIPYFAWLAEVATVMKGRLEYLILGDELEWKLGDPKGWNADSYLRFFNRAAEVIHKVDPSVKVSMYAATPSRWREVIGLINAGYTEHGDGVAINHYDYKVIKRLKDELNQYSPNKKLLFLSNGVGYIACDTSERNPPKDGYKRYNDLDQAAMIARTMYTWWNADTDVAPYYICMRNIVYHGKVSPCWYGFFGFMDLIIDEHDHATIKHYPGWHAFRTIAQVFHDRDGFKEPQFAVESTDFSADFVQAHERKGKELLIICWGKCKTNLRIESKEYAYPVQIDWLDYEKWRDIPAIVESNAITLTEVPLRLAPTIIRLVATEVQAIIKRP
jgi:hypothetical protein